MMIFYMICSTFVDHLYTENEENDDFAVEKNMNLEWEMNDFCTSFLDHLHIDNGHKYRVCIENVMLIFDEKLMIFEAFLGPKYIRKTCFYMFLSFFSTWKSFQTLLL